MEMTSVGPLLGLCCNKVHVVKGKCRRADSITVPSAPPFSRVAPAAWAPARARSAAPRPTVPVSAFVSLPLPVSASVSLPLPVLLTLTPVSCRGTCSLYSLLALFLLFLLLLLLFLFPSFLALFPPLLALLYPFYSSSLSLKTLQGGKKKEWDVYLPSVFKKSCSSQSWNELANASD